MSCANRFRTTFTSLFLGLSFLASHAAAGVGVALPGLDAFDQAIEEVLTKWQIPGASLAVAKDGRLVLAKGYGLADVDKKTPVEPKTLFRMGSINKTVTAVAVMQLVEQKKISLDEPILPRLQRLSLVPNEIRDGRISEITVRHLLEHTAGFDREKSGDPFFQPRLRDVARRQSVAPVTCEAIIKDTLDVGLDFAPGTRHAYSNVGYCILGKLVEDASGGTFKQFVSTNITAPVIGKPFMTGYSRNPIVDETTYHPYPGEPYVRGAPGVTVMAVPSPYGSYSVENMDALGAWVATPTEVLKVFLAIDGTRGSPLIQPESVAQMLAPPLSLYRDQPTPQRYYGLGVRVAKVANGQNWFHSGSQPGVQTLSLRAGGGLSWVVAFNSRPKDQAGFFAAFDKALWLAARSVRTWPTGNLFD